MPDYTNSDETYRRLFGDDQEQLGGNSAPNSAKVQADWLAGHPKMKQMYLQKRENPKDRLLFMYNPEEIAEGIQANWDMKDEKGVRVQQLEFKNSQNRELKMTLFFNDWGETRTVPIPELFTQGASEGTGGKPARQQPRTATEMAIQWLLDAVAPASQSTDSGVTPPVLELVWRDVFTCVLTDVSVTRLKSHPESMDAIRANIEITLIEHQFALKYPRGSTFASFPTDKNALAQGKALSSSEFAGPQFGE